MSEYAFKRMREIIQELCPHFTDNQVTHTCNKVSNGIRKWKGDCYAVAITIEGKPWYGDTCGCYFHYFDIDVNSITFTVRLAID